ncbi:MAG: hypothetical protein Kow00121_33900 [Elainellaceae cyanobacterium]
MITCFKVPPAGETADHLIGLVDLAMHSLPQFDYYVQYIASSISSWLGDRLQRSNDGLLVELTISLETLVSISKEPLKGGAC